MADYNSSYTGLQIDTAIGKVIDKTVETSADKVSFIRGSTGLSANNVQDALEELAGQSSGGGNSPRTYRVVVGTSTAGWTADDCDYFCTGSNDQTIISQAIESLPSTGGVVWFLDGIYNIENTLYIAVDNVTLSGNKKTSILSNQGSATMLLAGGSNFSMKDLIIEDKRASGSGATVVIMGINFRISGCRFTNLNRLSLSISGQDALLQDTDFHAAQITAAIGTHNGAQVWRCSRTGDEGNMLPWLQVSGNDINIIGNYVCNAYTGIDTLACQKVNIIDNYINSCNIGISTSGDVIGYNILNNMILNFIAYGIFTQSMNGQYINVTGNYVALDDALQTPSGTPIAIAGERNVITSNITPNKEITTMGSRVLIDNNSY